MANSITNIITVEKGEFDLSTIKSFSELLPIPEDLKNVPFDIIAVSVENIMGIGAPFKEENESNRDKLLNELYKEFPTKEGHERINQALANVKNHGFASWYNWCMVNWGTSSDMTMRSAGKNFLAFKTESFAPVYWLETLSKTLPDDVLLELEWAGDDFGCNTGFGLFTNSDVNIVDDEDESQQAYSRAVELLGEPDDLLLINGEWIWERELEAREKLDEYE